MGEGAEQRIPQADKIDDSDVKKAKGAECKILQTGSAMSACHLAACRSIYRSLTHKGVQPETIPLCRNSWFCGPMVSNGLLQGCSQLSGTSDNRQAKSNV